MDTSHDRRVLELLDRIVESDNGRMRAALAESLREKLTARQLVPVTYAALEKAMGLAVQVQATWAKSNSSVQRFRDEVLGGRLIGIFAQKQWVTRLRSEDGPATPWTMVRVYQGLREDGPPIHVQQVGRWEEDYVEYVDWGTTEAFGRLFAQLLNKRDARDDSRRSELDPFSEALETFKGDPFTINIERVPVRSGGVLDNLRLAAEGLHLSYGWHRAAAATWILTNHTPSVPTLVMAWTQRSILGDPDRIRVDAHPLVPPTYVQQAYQQERSAALGGRERLPSANSLRLAEFLLEQPAGQSWERRMQGWNGLHPERPYTERRLFARDGVRAMRAIEDLARGVKRDRAEQEGGDGETRE